MERLIASCLSMGLLCGVIACGRDRTDSVGNAGCIRATDCNDGIDCTDDSCSTSGVCRHIVTPALCAAGESCNPSLGCEPGRACATTTDCADTDACTTSEYCDPSARVCTYIPLDGDGDGAPPRVCGGSDCDDNNADVFDGAIEACNGYDDDCDGAVDEGLDSSVCSYCIARADCGSELASSCYAELDASFARLACANQAEVRTALIACARNACDGACEQAAFSSCTCPPSTELCSGGRNGSCSDVTGDPDHCGSCAASCSTTEICSAGECIDCPTGHQRVSNACTDVNECDGGSACGAGAASCVNTVGSYQCTCLAGFVGPAVGGTCTDVNECTEVPCGTSSVGCENLPGSYACMCSSGYAAPLAGGTCVDIDECAMATTCGTARADCDNTVGSYQCSCNAGYRAPPTGGTCVDINECTESLDDCDAASGALCSNLSGGFSCACPPGFTGTGHESGSCLWNDPSLTNIETSLGVLSPAFASSTTEYTLRIQANRAVSIAASTAQPTRSMIRIAGTPIASGAYSTAIEATLVPINVEIEVTTESGARRVYTVQIVRESLYFKASNTGVNDMFGSSVALSRDGSTLAVASHYESSNATGVDGNQADDSAVGAGAVYVFTRVDGSWVQTAYLKASNTGAYDSFGDSVALSDDGATLAVGASGEDSDANGVGGNQADDSAGNAGAVYLFARADSTWTQQAYVKASNSDADDRFGRIVALSGDGTTLAVSATGESSSAVGIDGDQNNNTSVNSGAIYVFRRAGAWSQVAYLKASNPDAEDMFGWSLAMSGDGGTLAIGALHESSNAVGVNGSQGNNLSPDSGAVYVFATSGAVWTQQAYVKASNTDLYDAFGWSVAMSYDGSLLVVGASGEDSNATGLDGDQLNNDAESAGASYVFARASSTWSQLCYLKASNTDAGDGFGSVASMSADGATLVISAPYEDSGADRIGGDQTDNGTMQAGAVYLFTADGAMWTQDAYVKAAHSKRDDAFGTALAISSDGSTFAMGSPAEEASATGIGGSDTTGLTVTRAGAVWVF